MKNISLVLNVILLVAVAVLYYLHFSSKGAAASANVTTGGSSVPGGEIVYVNTDSLFAKNDFYNDMIKDLEARKNQQETQLRNRGAILEKEINSYQARLQAGLLSANEQKAGGETLMKKRDELMQSEQAFSSGLMAAQRDLNDRLYDTLVNYLRDYNKDKNYRYIINHTRGGSILLPAANLDITEEVIKGLNDKYKKEKENSPAATTEKK